MTEDRKTGQLWNLQNPRTVRHPRARQLMLFGPNEIEVDQDDDTDTWCTPESIWGPCLKVARARVFGLDPATNVHSSVPAVRRYTAKEDGLEQDWLREGDWQTLREGFSVKALPDAGALWCNPPYSKPGPWIDRWCEADWFRDRFLLVKVATGCAWWQPLWAVADLILFFCKRQKFLRPQGPSTGAPFDSALAYAGPHSHTLALAFEDQAEPVWTGRNPWRRKQ